MARSRRARTRVHEGTSRSAALSQSGSTPTCEGRELAARRPCRRRRHPTATRLDGEQLAAVERRTQLVLVTRGTEDGPAVVPTPKGVESGADVTGVQRGHAQMMRAAAEAYKGDAGSRGLRLGAASQRMPSAYASASPGESRVLLDRRRCSRDKEATSSSTQALSFTPPALSSCTSSLSRASRRDPSDTAALSLLARGGSSGPQAVLR